MEERNNVSTGAIGGTGNERSGKASRFEDVKNTVADKLHDAAGALRGKVGTSTESPASGLSRYGHQASSWLDESAEYIRRFDYEQTNLRMREYVRQKPGRSLLMAGLAGLIIGAVVRRR